MHKLCIYALFVVKSLFSFNIFFKNVLDKDRQMFINDTYVQGINRLNFDDLTKKRRKVIVCDKGCTNLNDDKSDKNLF